MTRPTILVALLLAPVMAVAQAPIVATPLPPPDGQPSSEPEAPPVLSRPAGFPDVWVPRAGATIQALDKINARYAVLTVRPGQKASFQSLTIELKSCVIRPPEQPTDAAAFVTVTDSHPDAAPFSGWLLRSAPAVSMLQHPIFDLRVIGCLS